MIKKINNNNKILVISHIADIDGMGSIVLANKYYDNKIDYVLAEIMDLPVIFSNTDFSNYKKCPFYEFIISCCALTNSIMSYNIFLSI